VNNTQKLQSTNTKKAHLLQMVLPTCVPVYVTGKLKERCQEIKKV